MLGVCVCVSQFLVVVVVVVIRARAVSGIAGACQSGFGVIGRDAVSAL